MNLSTRFKTSTILRSPTFYGHGFSLPELLVITVILGVIASIGISAFFFLVRRERANSVALEVAGWIENVRNASADEVSPQANTGGCVLTFTTGNNQAAGAQLASVDQNCTLPETVLRIPAGVQQDTVLTSIASGASPVVFTPRGLWTDVAGNPTETPFQLNITLNGGGPLRCVRISPTLGSVEVGRPTTFAGNTCQDWQTL